jgi:hypothetical protein
MKRGIYRCNAVDAISFFAPLNDKQQAKIARCNRLAKGRGPRP